MLDQQAREEDRINLKLKEFLHISRPVQPPKARPNLAMNANVITHLPFLPLLTP
jgi:hypothetical protein